mgnify:CR=1 FL=1
MISHILYFGRTFCRVEKWRSQGSMPTQKLRGKERASSNCGFSGIKQKITTYTYRWTLSLEHVSLEKYCMSHNACTLQKCIEINMHMQLKKLQRRINTYFLPTNITMLPCYCTILDSLCFV